MIKGGRCSRSLVRRFAVLAPIFLFGSPRAARADVLVTKTHVEMDKTGTPGMLCEGDDICFTIQVECTVTPATIRLTDIIASNYYSSWLITQTYGTNCSTNVGPLLNPGPNGTLCASGVNLNVGDKLDFKYCATLRNNLSSPQKCVKAVATDQNLTRWESNNDCVVYDCVLPVPDVFTTKLYTGPASPVVGDTVSWRVEVWNRGTKEDKNVHVTDVTDPLVLADVAYTSFSRCPDVCLSPGTCSGLPDCVPAGANLDVTWTTLAASEKVSFTVQGSYVSCASKPGPPPPPNDPVCNIVAITSDYLKTSESDMERKSHPTATAPEGPTCVNATSGEAVTVDPGVKSLRDLDGPPTYQGDMVEYTVQFLNPYRCPSDLGNLTDMLPGGVNLVPGSVVLTPAGAGTDLSSGNLVVIDMLRIPGRTATVPGQVTVTFRATVTAAAGQVCNAGDYSFGTGNPARTNEVCFDVASGTPVSATKTHDDPNRNGTLRRGQKLQYMVHITNRGTITASDVKLSDTIPTGLSFVSVDDDAGGAPVLVAPLLEVFGIAVDPGTASAKDVRFTVMENGSQPTDTVVCNQATILTAANRTGPYTTMPNSACVKIVDTPPCIPPLPVWPLQGAKAGKGATAAAAWKWLQEFNSEGGYRVYSVEAKTDLKVPPGANSANARATKQCETMVVGDVACSDPDAFDPAQKKVLFYQVVGACADSTEGAN